MRRAAAFSAALWFCLLTSAPSFGDDFADEAELEFTLGAEAYQRGDYRGSLSHFLASNRLVPNRNVLFNIARCYERLKQFPEAHRYYTQALEAESDPALRERIETALSKIESEVAVLRITSDPPGATIYVDRKDLGPRGATPRALGLPAGSYTVIAELPGHHRAEFRVDGARVGESRQVHLSLEPLRGRVLIGAAAGGSAVRVDEPSAPVACLAPCTLDLSPGRHKLFFEKSGFERHEIAVDVVFDQEHPVDPTLTPLRGALVVNTDEPGALVQVDGRALGFTPGVFRLPVGTYRVRLELAGFRAVERLVRIREGAETQVLVELNQSEEVTAASRVTEYVEDAPSSVSIVPRNELGALRYPTVVEAVRGLPGIYSWDDRSYAALGFRGLGRLGSYGNRVLVLVDGQPLNDDWIGSSYVGYDGLATLDDLERIEVVRGPGSVVYGTNAFSGVINLVTRREAAPARTEIGLSAVGDSVGRARVRANVELGKDAGLWTSAAYANGAGRDFFFPEFAAEPGGGLVRDADGFEASTLHGRAFWKFFTLSFHQHAHDKRVPSGAFETLPGDPRAEQQDLRQFVELKAEPEIAEGLSMLSRLHLNRYTFSGGYPRPEEDGGLETDHYDGFWVGFEQRFDYRPSDAFRLTLGGEGQAHLEVEQKAKDNEGFFLDEQRPYEVGAAYLLADARAASNVRISAGARLDAYSNFGQSLNPRVALIWDPYEAGNSKLMVGKAFRAPSVYELYYNDGGVTQVASPDLDPENIYSVEIEHKHRFSSAISATLAAFGNYVTGLILDAGSGDAADPIYYENSSAPIATLGGEITLRRDFRQGYTFSVSYAYQRSNFLASDSLSDLVTLQDNPEFREVENSPEHLLSLKGAAPIIGRAVTLASRLTFESGRWDRFERVDEPEQQKTSAFAIWDVVFSGEDARWGLGWAFGVYNAFDTRYSLPVSGEFAQTTIAQSGRTLLLSGEWKY